MPTKTANLQTIRTPPLARPCVHASISMDMASKTVAVAPLPHRAALFHAAHGSPCELTCHDYRR
jgi:hypothetical protein